MKKIELLPNPNRKKDAVTETINAGIYEYDLCRIPPTKIGNKEVYNKQLSRANLLANRVLTKQQFEIEELKHANNDLKRKMQEREDKFRRKENFEVNQVKKTIDRENIIEEIPRIFKDNEKIMKLYEMLISDKWEKNAKTRKTKYKILDTLVEYKDCDEKRKKEIEIAINKWITM